MNADFTDNSTLQECYDEARRALRSMNETQIRWAQEEFLALGEYKNSTLLAERCRMFLDFTVGNIVTFGSYEGKPIRWKVMESSGRMRMLIAADVVAHQPYNAMRVDTYWQSATLRKWLNGEFLNEAFTPEQRSMIFATRRSNEPNAVYGSNAGLPTMDKVFILSHREAEQYLPEESDRDLGAWWWLRTPGCNLLTAESVYTDGSIYVPGVNLDYTEGGVRPALWLLVRDA